MKKFKIYLYYLLSNFPKKLLNFSIAVYFSKSLTPVAFLGFVLHYFQYLSVYFFNDMIDRDEDKRRKYIVKYKLLLDKGVLLKLGSLHLALPLIFLVILYGPYIAILSTSIVLFGIIRSFIRKKVLREISLGLLQIAQIYLFFIILGSKTAFIGNIFVISAYASLYVLLYYLHKTIESARSNLKVIAYTSMTYLLIVLSIPDLSLFESILLFISSTFTIVYCFFEFPKVSIKKYERILGGASILSLTLSIFLIMLGLYRIYTFPEIYLNVAYLDVVNKTVKYIIKNILF